jgi:hypothetical protein
MVLVVPWLIGAIIIFLNMVLYGSGAPVDYTCYHHAYNIVLYGSSAPVDNRSYHHTYNIALYWSGGPVDYRGYHHIPQHSVVLDWFSRRL